MSSAISTGWLMFLNTCGPWSKSDRPSARHPHPHGGKGHEHFGRGDVEKEVDERRRFVART
jgi:hypothetical protein